MAKKFLFRIFFQYFALFIFTYIGFLVAQTSYGDNYAFLRIVFWYLLVVTGYKIGEIKLK